MKFENFQGVLCGILAAVTYGANPLFALPLYQRGLTTTSVLFYRFALALALLGGWMLFRREPFRPNHPRQLLPLGLNGVFLGCSSLFLFLSFHHLDVGIAATILFVYPVLVCAIMYLGFGVRQGWSTLLGMGLALAGIGLLAPSGGSGRFSLLGLVFALLSALAFALYMVLLKVSSLRTLPAATQTFYAMGGGLVFFLITLRFGTELQQLPDLFSFGCALGLALLPSCLSFLLIAVAIRDLGPTKTAILGALEPVTALCFGILIFGETLTLRQSLGVLVILASVTLVAAGRGPTAGRSGGRRT